MIELDDCGKKLLLRFVDKHEDYEADVEVQMVIKAPRGTMTLFHNEPIRKYYRNVYGSMYSFPKQTRQCEAIRLFMKEHAND